MTTIKANKKNKNKIVQGTHQKHKYMATYENGKRKQNASINIRTELQINFDGRVKTFEP